MTTRMFAFLRAINTGGRRLTNAELLEPFRSTGLHDVAAYQAAGNVAFRSDRDPRELEVQLAALLHDAYGFETPAFVRSRSELRDVVAAVPFTPAEIARTEGRAQLTFLAETPTTAQIADVMALVPADDLVEFGDRHWWWLPRRGVSDAALPVGQIERIVGTMTMRTAGTVERMLARFDD